MAYRKLKPYHQQRDENEEDRSLRRKALLFVLAMAGVGIGIGAVFFGVYRFLGRSEFFQVTSIVIEGCEKTGKGEIQELAGIDSRTNLLLLKTRKVQEKVESHDWVEWAKVDKVWPNRVVIRVRERTPAALINLDGTLFYLDTGGKAFTAVQPGDNLDFPVVSGLVAEDLEGAHAAPLVKELLAFLREAGRGNKTILPRQELSELHVTKGKNGSDVVLFLASRPFPIHLGTVGFREKYGKLAKVLYWLYKRNEFEETVSIRLDYFQEKVLVAKAGAV